VKTTVEMTAPEMHLAHSGDSKHFLVIQLIEIMRAAGHSLPTAKTDPRNHMTLMITASAFLAGTLHGQLEVMGECPKRLRKTMENSLLRNYREGRTIGEKIGARALRESAEGTA
jgi:hypothetical protein